MSYYNLEYSNIHAKNYRYHSLFPHVFSAALKYNRKVKQENVFETCRNLVPMPSFEAVDGQRISCKL
jgi:hypothetical protein